MRHVLKPLELELPQYTQGAKDNNPTTGILIYRMHVQRSAAALKEVDELELYHLHARAVIVTNLL